MPAELSLRQKEVTIVEDSLERLSDYITDKLSISPPYAFRKDELFGVMGVGNKPTGKDGKVLASVTRKYGLTEVRRGSKEKRVRFFVREKAAETED